MDYARSALVWDVEPSTALDDSTPPFYQWFPDGKLNMCFNAVDRHVQAGAGDRVALAYESVVGGPSRDITYAELLEQVESAAGVLRDLGVEAGDRVLIYMAMVPETVVALL